MEVLPYMWGENGRGDIMKAKYFRCTKCNYVFRPSLFALFIAPKVDYLRYLRCPKCKTEIWMIEKKEGKK